MRLKGWAGCHAMLLAANAEVACRGSSVMPTCACAGWPCREPPAGRTAQQAFHSPAGPVQIRVLLVRYACAASDGATGVSGRAESASCVAGSRKRSKPQLRGSAGEAREICTCSYPKRSLERSVAGKSDCRDFTAVVRGQRRQATADIWSHNTGQAGRRGASNTVPQPGNGEDGDDGSANVTPYGPRAGAAA